MVSIHWTIKSEKHLQVIYDYIASDSQFYAKKFISDLIKKTDILKNMPDIGRIVPEFSRNDIREIIYKRYRVVYKKINENRIDILAVTQGSQLLENLGI